MYLNCHSYHSLRYGTLSIERLILGAKKHNIQRLCLTDINASAGVYDFTKKCRAEGIDPIVGIEFRVAEQIKYIGIAKNTKGFSELCSYLSRYNLTHEEIPDEAPYFENAYVIYPLEQHPTTLKENEFIGVRIHELNQLIQMKHRAFQQKMLALLTVTFETKEDYNLHKILRAVELNILGTKLKQENYGSKHDTFIRKTDLKEYFQSHPLLLRKTQHLLDQCSFDFEFNVLRNKKCFTENRESDLRLLTKLAYEGVKKRYTDNYQEALSRVNKELKVIANLEFAGYFLITWDIIQFSSKQGFIHVGRGSGANSIVSYCLGITDICPIELNLYFERFLNPDRTSPPDFDIDWSWKDRDTILDYIFNTYGRDYVAFCGTTVEFKYRSQFRELGKVFGLPKEELDNLSKNSPDRHAKNPITQTISKYVKLLNDFPNQRSMHACGILISEEPISRFTVVELLPKGYPTVQLNMHDAEAIGYEKFDILSQRGIGHINDSVRLIKENQGIDVDIRNISMSKNEAHANILLALGKTIGCFYIESPAMRGLLRRLKCNNYQTLVAASSIIRPGVAKSGMMKEYIFRHNNPTRFEYFHAVFKAHLAETYGIMVYQEDVIKIAHHFAGIDLAKADILRRAMSGKTRSIKELDSIKQTYFDNCKAKGYPEQLAQEVYRQIESFAGYSFCKAHSASYAVESYQSLYLKTHYPIEFMVAVIINEGGFYRTEVYVHEAKMAGAIIEPPCINTSEYLTTVKGKHVFLGFRNLQGLQEVLGKKIPQERKKNGPFTSVEDFTNRISIGIENLQILIFSGAFRFTGKSKNELILTARLLLNAQIHSHSQPKFLHESAVEYKIPTLERSPFEDAFDEIELLGFPVSCSPFDLLKTPFRATYNAKDFSKLHARIVKIVGYLISIKQVPTSNGKMNFGTWIDVEGTYFDTTHWANSLENHPFQGGGCYLLLGKIDVENDFPYLVVEKMAKLPFIPDPRYSDNADFAFKTQELLKPDISITFRAPYPSESGLPRKKMENS
jgi:DNA polymerase-3 subunit alpha/error-prone DNA polymerase